MLTLGVAVTVTGDGGLPGVPPAVGVTVVGVDGAGVPSDGATLDADGPAG